jgi:hypothetical protein
MRRLLLFSRWVLVERSPIRKIAISTTKHMAGTDAAPFLSYLRRLVPLNALVSIKAVNDNLGLEDT